MLIPFAAAADIGKASRDLGTSNELVRKFGLMRLIIRLLVDLLVCVLIGCNSKERLGVLKSQASKMQEHCR